MPKPSEYTLVLTPDEAMLIAALVVAVTGMLPLRQAQFYLAAMGKEEASAFMDKINAISSRIIADGHQHGK